MLALSMTQPYAELLVTGQKTIELRPWNRNYRGVFYIHASKKEDRREIGRLNFNMADLEFGAVIGRARLNAVKQYNNKEEVEQDADKHFALDYFTPEQFQRNRAFGFLVDAAVKFERPVPCLGALGFFTLPKGIEDTIKENES